MTVMSDLIERGGIPEGYKVEIFDGRVIMTPQSPERDWTVSDVKDAVIADPFKKTVTLLSEPHASGYGRAAETPYGESISFTLATGERVKVDTSTFPTREA